ncbi:MAG: TatD family hydrolase [Bacteroidetes bacterium]|nr:TatD family hydrolase [Bacteroidota bacterium]
MLVDTHTHLYLDDFDADWREVVDSAIESGVKYMLLPRIDSKTFEDQKKLSEFYPDNCLSMVGLHPTSVNADFEKELVIIENELRSSHYVAIGEIGIDLYWDQTFKEQQKEAFRRQLMWAKEFELPVSIHMRDSFNDIYQIVKEEKTSALNGIFHCFTGTLEESEKIVELGFKMGLGGILTFKNAGLAEVVKDIPMEHLVLETDAPFLSPVPFRGKRNESKYLVQIAKKLAEIKGITLTEVAEMTTANAASVFKLKM